MKTIYSSTKLRILGVLKSQNSRVSDLWNAWIWNEKPGIKTSRLVCKKKKATSFVNPFYPFHLQESIYRETNAHDRVTAGWVATGKIKRGGGRAGAISRILNLSQERNSFFRTFPRDIADNREHIRGVLLHRRRRAVCRGAIRKISVDQPVERFPR